MSPEASATRAVAAETISKKPRNIRYKLRNITLNDGISKKKITIRIITLKTTKFSKYNINKKIQTIGRTRRLIKKYMQEKPENSLTSGNFDNLNF